MEDLKKKLQDEIQTLEYEMNVELPKEIQRARAHGDLRENAEFHAAKERQRFVDARLAQLKMRLAELSLVDITKIPRDRVGLGSTVVVMDLKKEEEITSKLGGRRLERVDFDQFTHWSRIAWQAGGRRGEVPHSGRHAGARDPEAHHDSRYAVAGISQ
jgi:transcription elongation GreA/GreB family factor